MPWTITPSCEANGFVNDCLGGGIPDVPITVDAMLPDEPAQHATQADARHTRNVLLDVP